MIVAEKERLLFRINAAWKAMETTKLALWSETIAPLDFDTATAAVNLLVRTKTHSPSIAEFLEAYRASTPTKVTRAVEAPVDAAGRDRVHAIVEAFKNRSTQPITEQMLDAAGVPNWRKRLAHARLEDEDRGTHRANYDLAWMHIKNELADPSFSQVMPGGTE